jgi:hypothetical protein
MYAEHMSLHVRCATVGVVIVLQQEQVDAVLKDLAVEQLLCAEATADKNRAQEVQQQHQHHYKSLLLLVLLLSITASTISVIVRTACSPWCCCE